MQILFDDGNTIQRRAKIICDPFLRKYTISVATSQEKQEDLSRSRDKDFRLQFHRRPIVIHQVDRKWYVRIVRLHTWNDA